MRQFLCSQYPVLQLSLLSLSLLFGLSVQAQTFVPQTLPGIKSAYEVYGYTLFWADIDNDGDLDVYSVYDEVPLKDRVYQNEKGIFLPVEEPSYFLSGGRIAWGDVNNDGWLDLVGPVTVGNELGAYTLDGCGLRYRMDDFAKINNISLSGSNRFGAGWADDDLDGDGDVLVYSGYYVKDTTPNGQNSYIAVPMMGIFRWEDGAFALKDSLASIGQATVIGWEDYDRDGDPDILLQDNLTLVLYRNEEGTYRKMPDTFSAHSVKSVQWADVNQDGYLDIVTCSTPLGQSDDSWFLNTEVYTFQNQRYQRSYSDSIVLPHTFLEQCEVGDLNNDGNLDLMVSFAGGIVSNDGYSQFIWFYHGDGKGAFSLVNKAKPLSYNHALPRLVDYERDGDLDISIGRTILLNSINSTPVLPSVPAGLASSVNGHDVALSWQASTDARYLAEGLTYNVHIFSSVKGLHYLHGMSHLPTGKRSVLRRGNAGALTQKTIKNLPDGTYSWMVQAIDPNYNASAYSAPQSFTIVNGAVLTGSIALGTLQWLNTCECNEMVMEVKPTGTFGPDNRFLLQLSDSTSSFASPTTLFDNYFGDKAGYHNGIQAGKLSGWLPKTMPQGTHYHVRVISTHPARVSADNGYDIAVNKAPQLPGSITAPSKEVCIDSPDTQLKLSAAALYKNHYAWDIQPSQAGVITGNGLEVTLNWANEYSGPVQIRVKGVNGCGDGPYGVPLELFVRPLPAPANSPRLPETICPGQTSVLVEVDSAAYADSYEWTLPPGASVSTGTANNRKAIRLDFAADFTAGTLSVVPKSACGVGQAGEALIEVPGKIAKAAPIEGPDTLCAGQSWGAFTVPVLANATHYEWTLPGGISSSSGSTITDGNQLLVQVANQSFEGNISVVGFNACFQGEASPPLRIRVLKPATQPGSIQGPVEVCPGKTIASYQVEPIQEASGYEWRLPRGMQPLRGTALTATNRIMVQIERNFEEASIYLQALNPCGYSPVSLGLLVKPMPSLQAPSITQTCNTLKAEGATAFLQWFFNKQAITSATVPELAITRKGTYSVRVYGLCDTLEASLTTEPVFGNKDEIPNAFSPNGDGKNESFQLADKLLGSKLTIYNRWGELVYQSENYQNDWQGEQQVGIYYYSLVNHCLPKPINGIITLLR